MENITLNQEFVSQYIRKYSASLLSERLGSEKSIDGKEILKLSESRQINLFVIKILFQEWQEEMKKLESPYFDYKNPEVRKAMVEFMNTLSQNISVKGKDLRPLLENAVEQTFILYTDPASYLEKELENKTGATVSDKIVSQLTKYLVVLKDEMKEFLSEVIGDPSELLVEKSRYFFKDHDTVAYLKELVTELKEIEPADVSDFLEIETKEEHMAADTDHEEEDIEADTHEEEIEEPENSGVIEESKEEEFEKEFSEEQSENSDSDVVANDDFETEEDDEELKTLNDKFEIGAKTLADLHEEKKIDSIMEAISINHRYMFLQELFDGDNEQFTAAVERIEKSNSFDQAVEMLVQNYSKEYFWDMNSDEVKEFLKVVFRYFR